MIRIRCNRILMLGIVLCLAIGQLACAGRHGSEVPLDSGALGPDLRF